MNTLKPPFCLRNRTLPVEGGGSELDFCCCCVGNRVGGGGMDGNSCSQMPQLGTGLFGARTG